MEVWRVHRYVGTDGETRSRDLPLTEKLYRQNVGKKLAGVMWRKGRTWVVTTTSAGEKGVGGNQRVTGYVRCDFHQLAKQETEKYRSRSW